MQKDGQRANMSVRSTSGRRIYQDIALQLTRKIDIGEFANGSFLPSERELAETFGASRTSVREALLSLRASGLITGRRWSRTRVIQLDDPAFFSQLSGVARNQLARPNGVAEFLEACMLFECGLARFAAAYASPKDLDRLADALADNKRSIGEATLFAKTDAAFHRTLAEISGNSIFVALSTALCEWLIDLRTACFRTAIQRALRQTYLEHAQLYDAIAARNVAAAEAATEDHWKMISRRHRVATKQVKE